MWGCDTTRPHFVNRQTLPLSLQSSWGDWTQTCKKHVYEVTSGVVREGESKDLLWPSGLVEYFIVREGWGGKTEWLGLKKWSWNLLWRGSALDPKGECIPSGELSGRRKFLFLRCSRQCFADFSALGAF